MIILIINAVWFKLFGLPCRSDIHQALVRVARGAAVAREISSGRAEKAILICGTGIGMSITANKFPRVRATLCHDEFTAAACREHNDSNILVMGARVLTMDMMKKIVDIWLATEFGGGRHQTRLDLISDIEKEVGMQ